MESLVGLGAIGFFATFVVAGILALIPFLVLCGIFVRVGRNNQLLEWLGAQLASQNERTHVLLEHANGHLYRLAGPAPDPAAGAVTTAAPKLRSLEEIRKASASCSVER